ncbi:helix-turn-helix domain-containing protein [Candidatus Chloroploca sp. Khr17]|uniref:AlbA family DNA-binding domain-containing protein n=1 Tax=Candidatus Chloroploca sp. Khr17 TaxID=2496869 RepID=UPI00101BA5A3|nr:helix-turn-helix domain-containing protein [Candidatus Chloroploca sp. Khr17]
MDEATLRQLIAGGETPTVEFKSSAARPIDIAERMCGMANNRAGGMIIFGIEDATRAIVGVRQPSLTQDHILRASRMIKPPVSLAETSVQTWLLDGHTLVSVEVPGNSGRLYQYNGACFVRRGTTTVPLSIEEINAFLNAYEPSRWELSIARNTAVEDLDPEALDRYFASRSPESRARQRHSSETEMLIGLKAVADDPQTGEARPTHAGLLMFGYDPQLYLPQSEVVCIKYADTQGIRTYIDRKNFVGTMPELIDKASSFLRQYIRVGATIRGFYREDEPEYPYEALREAVVNAVVHRDYARSGETVRVFLYSDRVEIRSPGALLPGVSLDDLVALRVTSVPRNPVLAGLLRDLPGYMERIGSGIRLMLREMEALGLPPPEFSEHFDFVVTFRNRGKAVEPDGLNERQLKALEMVRVAGSISTSEYCAATGVSPSTGLRDLTELAAHGLLVARGKRRAKRFYLP